MIRALAIGCFSVSTIAFLKALLTTSDNFPHPDDALEFVLISAATAFCFWALGCIMCILKKARGRWTFIAGAAATISGLLLWLSFAGIIPHE
jgi:hypothetical protein